VETRTEPIISVKNLVKLYNNGEIHALDDCSLDIAKGDVVAIIGPSGSGKSTMLRSLNLLEEPTSGSIHFNGVNIADKSVDINLHRQKMGMVFQHFNLFPHMTVKKNITLAPVHLKLKTQAEADAMAEKLLKRLKKDTVLLELASAPGGFEPEIATALGLKVISASGLPGQYAPLSAAELMRESIYAIIAQEEE